MRLRRLAYGFSSMVLSLSSVFVLLSPVAHAAGNTCTWTGATDLIFETATNWTCSGGGAGSAPTDDDLLVFPVDVLTGTAGATITIAGDRSFAGITVSGTYSPGVAGGYTLSGSGTTTLTGPVNITASGGASFIFGTNVTLGANVTIDSPASIYGNITFASFKTLNVGTYNLALTGTAQATVLGSVAGSGNVSTALYLGLLGDNSAFSGQFATTAAEANLFFNGIDALKGSVSIYGGSVLDIYGLAYGTNQTIAVPITINGSGYEGLYSHIPALTVSLSGGLSSPATTVEFTNVTLANNSDIRVLARDNDTVKFSGSGLGSYTFAPVDGSQGTLIVGGQTIKADPTVTTYADSQPTVDLTVGDNEILVMNGTYRNITLDAGSILKGTGTIAVLTVNGGSVAPGLSPGILNSGNVSFTGGSFDAEIGGTTAGSGYDQLNVTGTVDLGSATTLNVTHWSGFRPALNDTFTIINNDGADAVTGTFQGLAQGATVTVDGVIYTISYTGGTGNDVVLTATDVSGATTPTAPNTGFEHFSNNPLATLLATLAIVTVVSIVARRQLKSEK